MAKYTIYKVAAAVYDIYCKSQHPEQNEYVLNKILRYHQIGNQLSEAMRIMDIYEINNGWIIWKGNAPTIEMIEKINEKRKEICLQNNMKIKVKEEEITKTKKNTEEINQYKDALEKALLRINELERKETFKDAEIKKSFISKLFS
jgi:hypothetical protein